MSAVLAVLMILVQLPTIASALTPDTAGTQSEGAQTKAVESVGLLFRKTVLNNKVTLYYDNNRNLSYDTRDTECNTLDDKWSYDEARGRIVLTNFEWITEADVALTIPFDVDLLISGNNTLQSVTKNIKNDFTCGLYAKGNLTIVVASNSRFNAYGGDDNSTDSTKVSYGIRADKAFKINGGIVYAEGGDTKSASSVGVGASYIGVQGGTLNATGGAAENADSAGLRALSINLAGGITNAYGGKGLKTYGIYAVRESNSEDSGHLKIGGGTITAKSGDCVDKKAEAYGIKAYTMEIGGGTIKGTGGDTLGGTSTGVWVESHLEMPNGNMTAIGGAGRESTGISLGTSVFKGGVLRATGGIATADSRGMFTTGTTVIELFTKVFLEGGPSEKNSCGLYARGTVRINANSNGEFESRGATASSHYSYGVYMSVNNEFFEYHGGKAVMSGDTGALCAYSNLSKKINADAYAYKINRDSAVENENTSSTWGEYINSSGQITGTPYDIASSENAFNKFIRFTSTPFYVVEAVTISGTVGSALTEQTAKLTMYLPWKQNTVPPGAAKDWFAYGTAIPDGVEVEALIDASDPGTITLLFSGTPTEESNNIFNITIPYNLPVLTNPDAKFELKHAYDMSAQISGELDFGTLYSPYQQPTAKTVTITNTGTGSIQLTKPTSTNFDIGELSATTIAANESATFTVQPKPGLSAQDYSETISISGIGMGLFGEESNPSVSVTAKVKVEPTAYTINATQDLVDFGSSPENYATPPAAQTLTITNTGTGAIALNQPTATNYDVNLSKTRLNPGETATFTVQPKTGLGVGTYDETITITGENGASAPVIVRFAVLDKTVTVGAQGNSVIEGKSASVAYTVTTANFGAGTYNVTLSGVSGAAPPTGVTLSADSIDIDNNGTGTLTLKTTDTTPDGSHNLTITMDGKTSAPFALNILPENAIFVDSVDVAGVSDVATIDTKYGDLQMNATVLPANANLRTVTWSLTNGTGSATISQDGLLTAVSNGTVTVTASATDGSGKSGSATVTISGQPPYKVIIQDAVNGTASASPHESTIIGTLDSTEIILSSFPNNGYIFENWDVISGNVGVTGDKFTMPTNDVTLKPIFKPIVYTITLHSNDGKSDSHLTYTVETGANLTDITRAHHTFDGWYNNAQLTGRVETSIQKGQTGNREYWAKWTPATYTVTLYDADKVDTSLTSYIYGNVTTLPTGYSKNGYTFDGWYTTQNFSGPAVAEIGADEYGNKTFYAKWSPILVTGITIGTENGTKTIGEYGGSLHLTAVVSPANALNKTVTWSLTNGTGSATISEDGLLTAESDGTVIVTATAKDGSGSSASETITISGQIPYQYKVTIEPVENGRASASPQGSDSTSDRTEITLTVQPDIGYTFKNWEVIEGNVEVAGDNKFIMPKSDVTLKPIFEPREYTITLHHNDGTDETTSLSYNIETGAVLPDDITREHHVFDGWYNNQDFEGSAVTEIGTGQYGTQIFYAKWKSVIVTEIHINTDGVQKSIDTYGGTLQFTVDVEPLEALNATTILWTVADVDNQQYRAVNTTDGTLSQARLARADDVSSEVCTRARIDQNGLLTAVKNGTVIVTATATAGDGTTKSDSVTITISGQPFTITFDPNGGMFDSENTQEQVDTDEHGKLTELPAEPTQDMYSFQGWYTQQSESDGTKIDIGSEFEQDTTVYARWKTISVGNIHHHTVRFNTNGGSAVNTQHIVNMGTVTIPGNPNKDDFIFDGWYVDEELSKIYDFKTPVTNNLELYAKWIHGDTKHIAYMEGAPDGSFSPNNYMTRAEAAMMLFRLAAQDETAKRFFNLSEIEEDIGLAFSDVLNDQWYSEAVMTLAGMSILKGYPDGSFMPNAHITRAEFITMMTRFSEPVQTAAGFPDVPAAYWAFDAIAIAKKNRWISGYPDGSFRPDAFISRAEAVKVINVALDRTADMSFVASYPDDIRTFNDVDSDFWAFGDIIEASITHYCLIDNNENEIWTLTDLTSEQ